MNAIVQQLVAVEQGSRLVAPDAATIREAVRSLVRERVRYLARLAGCAPTQAQRLADQLVREQLP